MTHPRFRLLLTLLSLLFGGAAARADWPARVFAPYMYLGTGQTDQLTLCNDATGQLYFTLAFIIADQENNPSWYDTADRSQSANGRELHAR